MTSLIKFTKIDTNKNLYCKQSFLVHSKKRWITWTWYTHWWHPGGSCPLRWCWTPRSLWCTTEIQSPYSAVCYVEVRPQERPRRVGSPSSRFFLHSSRHDKLSHSLEGCIGLRKQSSSTMRVAWQAFFYQKEWTVAWQSSRRPYVCHHQSSVLGSSFRAWGERRSGENRGLLCLFFILFDKSVRYNSLSSSLTIVSTRRVDLKGEATNFRHHFLLQYCTVACSSLKLSSHCKVVGPEFFTCPPDNVIEGRNTC